MIPPDEFDARSLLFIPADADRFIAKGAERGADVIILDLEDGVAPSSKARARAALLAAVQHLQQRGATDAEAAAATRPLKAFDAGIAQGKGAIALDGKMLDVPIANRARLFLRRRNARIARQSQLGSRGATR